jgi:hypothetical protein
VGGIAMKNLYTEQGLAQVEYAIGGLRCNNEKTTLTKTLLESYIIASGIIINPLEDHQTLNYIWSESIDSIKMFLQNINGNIIISTLQTFNKMQVREEPIMEKATRYIDNQTKLEAINNCRLYLQIMTMAELTDVEGKHILHEAFHGTRERNGNPTLTRNSKTFINWPTQPKPPEKAWSI